MQSVGAHAPPIRSLPRFGQLRKLTDTATAQIAQLQTTPSQGAKLVDAKAKLAALLQAYQSTLTAQALSANDATQAKLTQQPNTSRNVRVAALVGLSVGLILAFVTEFRWPSGRAGIRFG